MIPLSNTTPQAQTQGHSSTGTAAAKAALEIDSELTAHWRVAWKFAVHTCVGTLIFGTIAVPAVLLNWSVEWMESVHRTDPVIVLGLRFVEYGIFGGDVLLFLAFLWKSWKRTIREL